MSLLSKLFGRGGNGSSAAEREPEIYKDFRIFPEPVKEAGGYRVAARIEKEIDGDVKVHRLVRADTIQSAEEATKVTVNKAKQLIDEQGDALF